MKKRILLIQIRDPKDAMIGHESDCVRRKLADLDVHFSALNAVEASIDASALDPFDGIIIGGSGDFSVHHPLSARFVTPLLNTLDVIARRKLPTFGICFGHQLIGRWLGATVQTDPERAELGTVEVTKTEEGQAHPILASLPRTFSVHSGHSDLVTELPDGCDLMLENHVTKTQSFQVRDLPIFTVQFHPDMTGGEARTRLLAYRDGFADRIQTDAEAFASRFAVDQDESAILLKMFFKEHGWSSAFGA